MSVCVWIGVVQEEESTPLELLKWIHEYLVNVCGWCRRKRAPR